jgi:hypothetical protein
MSDHFRRSSSAPSLPGYREWQHFVIAGGGVPAIVNFGLVEGRGAPLGSVLVLVHDGEWSGDLRMIPQSDLDVRAGSIDAHFGESAMEHRGGSYVIRAGARGGVDVLLRLTPRSTPFTAHNLETGDGGARSWLVLPRLVADGTIHVNGRAVSVRSAVAYHDHNWGSWTGDVVWEWGFGLPERDDGSPWSLVFGRLVDERRGCILMQSLFLWDGGDLCRMFRDRQISAVPEGSLRSGRLLKVPAVMRFLYPGDRAAVPGRFAIEATAGGDRLDVNFEAESAAQVFLPRSDNLGATEINETAGALRAAGVIRGKPVDLRGRGVFEFVHARA